MIKKRALFIVDEIINAKIIYKKIFEVAKRGDAREESYYSSLEQLLKDYSDSISKRQVQVTTLPKKNRCRKS